jgi:hypothetical protein
MFKVTRVTLIGIRARLLNLLQADFLVKVELFISKFQVTGLNDKGTYSHQYTTH